jgi:uncharacterized protein YutD|tara:strand:- start:2883 stop:3125 length:243 start_codon:yes stop_codon:yes gene_type:complete
MSKQKQKKLGYKEYEGLLSQAHQKIEILANKVHELQTYLIGYVEFRGQNIMFNDWMNKKIKEMEAEVAKKQEAEKVHEKV